MCIMQIGCMKNLKSIWLIYEHVHNLLYLHIFLMWYLRSALHIFVYLSYREGLLVCGHFVQGTFLPTNKFLLRQSLPKGKESYLGWLSLPPIHFHPLNKKVASIAFLIFFYDQSSHYFLTAWVVLKWNFVEIFQRKKMWGCKTDPSSPGRRFWTGGLRLCLFLPMPWWWWCFPPSVLFALGTWKPT